jgi:hypothetical protein
MPEQTVNKFVIRQSMKALQDQQVFQSLEELAEAIADDLFEEGFTVSVEDRAKITKIVEEKGYTGRFALDDLVKRKLKNKKLLPVISVVMAALAFFVTTAVAALIEHYVQKPLEGSRSAPLTAVFQLPDLTGPQLDFKVQLSNHSGEALRNVVLFASVDQVTRQFPIQTLESGQSLTVTGTLDVSGVNGNGLDFVGYVIAGDFSLRCQPTRIARRSAQLAVAEPPRSEALAPGMMAGGAGQENSVAVRNVGRSKMTNGKKSVAELDNGSSIAAAPGAALSKEAPTFKTVESNVLQAKDEVLRLAERDDAASRELLKAYAAAGHPKAIELTP